MGWTYTHRNKFSVSLRDFFQRGWTGHTILDSGTVNRREFYAAVRDDKTGEVFAFIALLDFRPKDDFNFGYKDMSENSGPYACNCPKRILDLLTPTDSEYAKRWREDCRKNLAKRASVPKVKKGDTLKFKEAICFRSGTTLDTFLVTNPRSSVFFGVGAAGRYRIPKWRGLEFEIIERKGA